RPASFSTRRCCEIAGRETSKCDAMAPALSSSSRTSRRMSRRRGSASARIASSTPVCKRLLTDAVKQPGHAGRRFALSSCAEAGFRVGGGCVSENRRFTYQPALDGLRAFAVLSVVAYHLDAGWARGGFLGVDAFF